jgi:hypothetical protein
LSISPVVEQPTTKLRSKRRAIAALSAFGSKLEEAK